MLWAIEYRLLRHIFRPDENRMSGAPYKSRSKIEVLLGVEFWKYVVDKTVIDYGCGNGTEVLEIAAHDAKRAIGLDYQERLLAEAKARVNARTNVVFTTCVEEPADVILSLDAFEHFDRPNDVLREMANLLTPEGSVFISFGPTWFHPLGGHLFSVFPWAHLLFSERALMRWRQDFKVDGATKFEECAGGLNRMSIRRFEELVAQSPLKFAEKQLVPIHVVRHLHCRLTREFLTATVRCRLVKR